MASGNPWKPFVLFDTNPLHAAMLRKRERKRLKQLVKRQKIKNRK